MDYWNSSGATSRRYRLRIRALATARMIAERLVP